MTPYYLEYDCEESQQYIYPYVSLQANDDGTTNETLRIYCPLVGEN